MIGDKAADISSTTASNRLFFLASTVFSIKTRSPLVSCPPSAQVSMLAAKGFDPSMVLDSAFIAPITVSGGTLDSIQRDIADFKDADLLTFVPPVKEVQEESHSVTGRLLSKYLR